MIQPLDKFLKNSKTVHKKYILLLVWFQATDTFSEETWWIDMKFMIQWLYISGVNKEIFNYTNIMYILI